MKLEKITTRYLQTEDRILLSGASRGDSVDLWLTARLMKQLVPCLLDWLEGSWSAQSVPSISNCKDETKAPQSSKLQAAGHRVVKQQLARHEEVPVRKQNPPLLIQAVKCQRREGSILLIFQWAKQEGVQLSLAPANLEAWLVTLHKLWVLAEWEDIWPQWINELSQAVKTETLKKMH